MSSRADSASNWRQRQSSSTAESAASTSTPASTTAFGGAKGTRSSANGGGRQGWRTTNRSFGDSSPRNGVQSSSKTSSDDSEVDLSKRIYLGNLLYFATVQDVEGLLTDYDYSKVVMSIDPFTSRNPSYCFVDFVNASEAQRAMQELDGKILLDRPVKTRQATASRHQGRAGPRENDGNNQRKKDGRTWGNDRWSKKPTEALQHHFPAQGSRLWVGNLPGFDLDPPTVQRNLKQLFSNHGFEAIAVSKIIPAREATEGLDSKGFNHYAFVDFADIETARKAQQAVDGTPPPWEGPKVKVRSASGGPSWKVHQRQDYVEEKGLDAE